MRGNQWSFDVITRTTTLFLVWAVSMGDCVGCIKNNFSFLSTIWFLKNISAFVCRIHSSATCFKDSHVVGQNNIIFFLALENEISCHKKNIAFLPYLQHRCCDFSKYSLLNDKKKYQGSKMILLKFKYKSYWHKHMKGFPWHLITFKNRSRLEILYIQEKHICTINLTA